MKLSSGILVFDAQRELLLCHVTGSARWDIPKGGLDEGEAEIDAAIRETAEETGLRFAPGDLLDLGRFRYRSGKDLRLYATLSERVDIAHCSCSTHYRDARGRLRPEMDGFAWVPLDDVGRRCGKNLAALFERTLGLAVLWERLRAERPGHEARPAPR